VIRHTVRFDRRGRPHPLDARDVEPELRRARRTGGFVWIEAWAPDKREMARLARLLDLNPRSAAEAAVGRQQPKVLRYDGHLTLVVWTLEFRAQHPRVAIAEVFLYITRTALLSVRRPRTPDSRPVSSALADPDAVVAGGPLGAAFALIDDLCDEYAQLTGLIEDELEDIEQEVYDDSIVESRARIYRLRQQIGKISRAVSSLSTALQSSGEHLRSVSVGGNHVGPYLRDLVDRLSGMDALLHDQSSTLDAVVASHENNAASRQNNDTRKISAIAALISVPALTAGVWGMNFTDLPLVKVPYGWAWILGGALLLDVVIYIAFRRREWL